MEINFYDVNGQNIFVRQKGDGPPLLLIHGFPLHSAMWNKQIDVLGNRYEVIAPDLSGFGNTQSATDDWSMSGYAMELSDLLDVMNIERVIFCGLSMGGYVGFEFWKLFPQKLAHLVLCNTRSSADTEITARGRRQMAKKVLQDKDIGFIKKAMLPRLIADSKNEECVSQVDQMFNEVAMESIAKGQFALASRNDFDKRLPEIHIPTTVIAGELDPITPSNEMRAMSNLIPNSEFVSIKGAGHLTPMEAPDQFNNAFQKIMF